jgi:hypothetical protein
MRAISVHDTDFAVRASVYRKGFGGKGVDLLDFFGAEREVVRT